MDSFGNDSGDMSGNMSGNMSGGMSGNMGNGLFLHRPSASPIRVY